MWNRILGNDPSTSTPERRRKNESQRSIPRRSETAKSTTTEENDRGFNPTSTSYSSTTRNKYPGTASASIASSYATASSHPNNDPYFPPGLVRNASLADQVPTSFGGDGRRTAALDSSSKSEGRSEEAATMDTKRHRKDRGSTRDQDDGSRDTKEDRSKKSRRDSRRDSRGGTERAMSVDEAPYASSQRVDQVAAGAGLNGTPSFASSTSPNDSTRPEPTYGLPQSQSSHVQDQFPGQFPSQSAAPYRPPLAASEGGPGLAAEYYGDAGQSVSQQPGFRVHSPSLIIGAEPHLQAASAVAAPPPEPSATGGIGAAASFFDPNFSAGSDVERPQSNKPTSINGSSISQYSSAAPASSTYATSSMRPPSQQASSAPVIPTLGAAALGAAAIHHTSDRPSRPSRPEHGAVSSSSMSAYGRISGSASHQQSSETHASYTSQPSSTRPPSTPGKASSHSSNIPLYAAGAAGLAAAAHHHNYHHSSQHSAHGQHYAGSTMAQQQRHRHRGPMSKFVDFFKDPDGVAQFEEYTEYIGVCRHCFAPGSSPRDAPRRHHYPRRRSNERFGSSVRVDKDNRYWSSENESRRRKNKSWLGAGIAGYGLAKVGESLFKQSDESDDSRKARKSHHRRRSSSSDRKSYTSRGVINRSSDSLSHRKHSANQVQTGITSDGKLYRKDSHGNFDVSSVKVHGARHRSRSRSTSRDRKHRGSNAALSTVIGSSIVASSTRQRSRSPKKAFVRSRHEDGRISTELASVLRLDDPESREHRRRSDHSLGSKHRTSTKKQKKSRGFFTFSNSSSSSSASSNMAFGADIHRKATKYRRSKKDGKKTRDADAALLGLEAAAAALALSQNQRSKHKGELVAVKESKGKHKSGKIEHKGKKASSTSSEDLWESASEGDWSSADSELAYGTSLRRRSEESLSSDASGLDKWSWRWGSKKQAKKPSNRHRHSSDRERFEPATTTRTDSAQLPLETLEQNSRMTSTSSVPMQHVYPMPTSDPTQFDVARHDAGFPFFQSQPFMNGRPDPVPIQHPQPVASVSPSVYTTQAPYAHSYSAPIGPSAYPQNSNLEQGSGHAPESFPTGTEYFEPFMRESKNDKKTRRRDSSLVTHRSEFEVPPVKPQRRKSLKDDSSSVRFDLTKEQEDKDRRDERRRRKEEEKRRERIERQESEERQDVELETRPRRDVAVTKPTTSSSYDSKDTPHTVKEQSWAAPAAAGVIAAAIGATVAAEGTSHNKRKEPEDRDIEVIVKEHHASTDATVPDDKDERGRSSKRDGMSIWQAAAKLQRSSSHTEYAAYFTPPELLSKTSDVKQIIGANADNDVTVYQVPNMITVEPSEPRAQSPSRAYSFPITAEDMQHSKKPLPWSVPKLNLVEPTPPTSRAGSVVGSRSPHAASPLSNEIPVDIPLEPLESLGESDVQNTGTEHAEYTVIEPKGRNVDLVESPVSEVNTTEAVPGISSLKNRSGRKKPPPEADYGDDLDFAATVAAGLQDTGFNPSIVIDDPSFRRRDSPPGSEEDRSVKVQVVSVTEPSPKDIRTSSPPHGFVEELPDHHIPGSFEDDDGHPGQSRSSDRDARSSRNVNNHSPEPEELTSPNDNNGVKPHIYTVEKEASETRDTRNATVDPAGDVFYGERRADVRHNTTEPSDNSHVLPNIYSAESKPLQSGELQGVSVDPETQRSYPDAKADDRAPSVVRADETIDSSPDVIEYLSDEKQQSVVSAPVPSSNKQESKSKKSKRRSVGFDDNVSVMSSPAAYGDVPEPAVSAKQGRKGGIFGLFSKAIEESSESKGAQQTPVEASLEDFEEPKERRKKSKSRKASRDDEDFSAAAAESAVSNKPEGQDDWSSTKKSKRGKEKRRSSEGPSAQDTGRITRDLPAQVTPPASPGHSRLPSSDAMLTNPEDEEPEHEQKSSRSDLALDDTGDPLRIDNDQQPSFLGERPKQPPLPDIPDASEDPGGQSMQNIATGSEQALQALEGHRESPSTGAEEQKRSLADLQSDGRRVSYSSPSPTAIPLRPMRFGRRPSSPGLAKSLPSTPQPSAAGESPFTPRRRERPHSTEFKSNEFRPMFLLEKYGSRQDTLPQEPYPSLPSSHTTSRASSVHESDDHDRAEGLRSAIEDVDYNQVMEGRRGLSIETGRYLNESELLDSQQTTPTAASFSSMVKEKASNNQETIPSPQQPEPAAIDADAHATSGEIQSEASPQSQRLLHGVDDLFPQRRTSSPSRYATTRNDDYLENASRASSPDRSDKQESSGLTSMIKDAAIGAAVGGSAAALLKSHSQHDEHSKQPAPEDAQEKVKNYNAISQPDPAITSSGRPTAEENRLLQEQDAQDAVDSWFATAQPKKSMKDKKGKKGSKSYQDSEAALPAVPQSDNSDPVQEAEETAIGKRTDLPQSDSNLEESALVSKPTELIDAPNSIVRATDDTTDPLGAEEVKRPSEVDVQTALLTRKDSKGKKKKSKKKGTQVWEDNDAAPSESVPSTTTLAEPQPDLMVSDERQGSPVGYDDSGSFPADAGLSQDRREPDISTDITEPISSTKKTKKGKKKDRMLSLDEAAKEESQEKSSTVVVGGTSGFRDLDAPVEQPEMSSMAEEQFVDPGQAASKEVHYVFPAAAETEAEAPANQPPLNEQPPVLSPSNNAQGLAGIGDRSSEGGRREEATLPAMETPVADQSILTTGFPAVDHDRSSKATNVSDEERLISAEAVPLPLDDDLDLLEALPESPVLQPIDAVQPTEDQDSVQDQRALDSLAPSKEPSNPVDDITVAPIAPAAESLSSQKAADSSEEHQDPVSIAIPKVVSELNLPDNAFDDYDTTPVKNGGDETLTLVSSKKAKKDKKSKKNKNAQASASEPGNEAGVLTPEPVQINMADADPETSREMSQGQPEAEWPDFTNKKGKKGKKGRKGKAFEVEPEDIESKRSLPEVQASVPSSFEEAPLASGLSEEPNPPKVDTPNLGQGEPTPDQFAASKGASVDANDGTVTIEDELQPVSKKQKGKKSKSVAFDNPTDDLSRDFEAAALPETPAATTNTTQEIQDLLHEPAAEEAERPMEHAQEEIPHPSAAEQPPTKPTTDHQPGQLDRPTLAEGDIPSIEPPAASVSTASEVQNILSQTSEPQESSTATKDVVVNPEQTEETDEFAWAPSKKKKRGKKAKALEDVVPAKQSRDEAQLQVSSEVEPNDLADIPRNNDEDLSFEPSKKDKKKKKRKSLSRAASDSLQEDVTAIAKPADTGEMAMTGAAPSILEKADGLPAIEMPMSPDMARANDSLLGVRQQTPDPVLKDLSVPETDTKPNDASDPDIAEVPLSSERASPILESQEMKMTTDAPSISEKPDQLPPMSHPQSVETAQAVAPSELFEDPELTITASQGAADPTMALDNFEESTDAVVPDARTSSVTNAKNTPIAEDISPLEEDVPVHTSPVVDDTSDPKNQRMDRPQSPAIAVEAAVPTPTLKEADEQVSETRDTISESKDDNYAEPIKEASIKTKKDKKKSKKAKVQDWTDATPEAPVEDTPRAEEVDQEDTLQLADLPGQAGESTTNLPAEVQSLSKKDKKKAKRAKAAAWDDDTPALLEEPAMERRPDEEAIAEPVIEQEDKPTAEKIDDEVAEPRSKSKKDKKKAKKIETLMEKEVIPEVANEGERETLERMKEPAATPSTLDSPLATEDLPRSKKDKKKGKKSKFVAWDEEGSAPPPQDEADQLKSLPLEPEAVAEPSDMPQQAQADEIVIPDEQPPSKKGKKKSKKSKFVGLDEEPSISLSTNEPSQVTSNTGPEIIANASEAQTSLDDFDVQHATDETASMPKEELINDPADQQAHISSHPTPAVPVALAEEEFLVDSSPTSVLDSQAIHVDVPSTLGEDNLAGEASARGNTVEYETEVPKASSENVAPVTTHEVKNQSNLLGPSLETEKPQVAILETPSQDEIIGTDAESAPSAGHALQIAEESISTPSEEYADAVSSFTVNPPGEVREPPASDVLESTIDSAADPQDLVHKSADIVPEEPQISVPQSPIPEASAINVDEEFAPISKKSKKKTKKNKSVSAWDDDDTAAVQGADPINQETPNELDESMERPSLPLAPSADNLDENIVPKSKKDKKKAKKSKDLSFNDEPSVTATPPAADTEMDEPARATEEPSVSASRSVAEVPEDLPLLSKKDKKKAKKRKTLSFDEEPPEDAPPIEPDVPMDSSKQTPEEPFILTELLDESPALSKKDKKKAKKLRKAVTWDDEDPEVPANAEEPEVLAQPQEQVLTAPSDQAPAEQEKPKSFEHSNVSLQPSVQDVDGFLPVNEQLNEPSSAAANPTMPDPVEEIKKREVVPETDRNLPASSKKSKKDTKKAKKGQALSWADDEARPEQSSGQDQAISEEPSAFASPTTLGTIAESSGAEARNPDQASNLEESDVKTVAAAEPSAEIEPEFTVPEKKSKRGKKSKKSTSSAYEPEETEPSMPVDVPEKETHVDSMISETSPQVNLTNADNEKSRQGDPDSKNAIEMQPYIDETDEGPLVEPTILSPIPEQELAPRHQDPILNLPTDSLATSIPTTSNGDLEQSVQPVTPPSPQPERFADPTPKVDESISTVQEPVFQSTQELQQVPEEVRLSTAQETTEQDDGFSSFAPTKKSKKSKKAKKQQIDWEDEANSVPASAEKSSKAADDFVAPVRPEMSAWPTEVRLNQTTATLPSEGQINPSASIANLGPSIIEPKEPAPIQEERSDYFGLPASRDILSPPQPFDYESHSTTAASAPEREAKVIHSIDEASMARDNIPPTANMQPTMDVKPQDEQKSAMPDQSRDEKVIADPADTFEGFTATKKDKKKRKQKKQMVDDVMWEFPAMNPPVAPEEVERMAPVDAPVGGEPTLASKSSEATPAIPPPDQQEVQDKVVIPEAPSTTEAIDGDFGIVAKKGKKGKKSKKNRAAEDVEGYAEPAEKSVIQERENIVDDTGSYEREPPLTPPQEYHGSDPSQDSKGEGSALHHSKSSEAVATAAAVGAGLVAATQLERKESKKGKKGKKSRQTSSDRAVLEEEPQSQAHSPVPDTNQEVPSRVPTPERRSPIQAWHQYISPSQSPKQSELYDVEQENPKTRDRSRRQSSNDNIRRQSITPERRSPTEAWHQYNTPRHSPQQNETYDRDLSLARAHDDGPKPTSGINRDSAVQFSDSPMIPEQSPVHRTMRDSGYPETEASPIIDRATTHQDPSENTRDFKQSSESADTTRIPPHPAEEDNPLRISSEDPQDFTRRTRKKRERSLSPPRKKRDHRDVDIPEHDHRPVSLEGPREPSPVSSTSKDRSSVLFHSSPSTREQHDRNIRAPTPPREDNSEMVNARAESLAALSGLREKDQDGQRPSLFGGPIGVSSDEIPPVTPFDQTGILGKRLKTITEYSPEESPLHKKDRDLADIGIPDHGVKAARRSGTPQAIQKRRTYSPSPTYQDGERRQSLDLERSRSRGTEQRPSSRQSNISSLVSGQPKQREYERRSLSGASNRSIESINAIIRTPPEQIRSASGMSNRSSGTPPLRRSDRSISSDLRGANRKSEAKKRAKQPEAEEEIAIPVPPSTTDDSAKNSGKSRVREMADVYVSQNHMIDTSVQTATDISQEGYGDVHGSPLSPTRPPSMRRRQSMQVLELESKLDQLASENRILQDAKSRAERSLAEATQDQSQEISSYRESIEARDTWLRQKDDELNQLKETLESQYTQVAQLTEINQGLHATSREIDDHHERYGQLEEEHADAHQRWQQSTRDLDDLRSQHAQLSAGMEDIVRHEVSVAVEEKNAEIRQLRDELDAAKEQVRTLQQQILASKRSSDDSIIIDRDEDYFDGQCHSLCQHVQQWVLRFSKFSDGRACYLASEIRDEKTVDRMENSILDGSDVDTYLADRVQRRDVFMSMVMTMTWEFIFTRYLFGADREQRQKLKSLEKTLTESVTTNGASMSAVHKWRATTLSLLSRREAFRNQRAQDTEAVMQTIYSTLATILPPPSHLVEQIQSSLRKVLASAVDLSLEMRTQRAEYVMLPPLQPEYDTNGDLARKVYFNASLMNERAGGDTGNEELEARSAVVRMVLFPLVVRKGDDGLEGTGDEI
ncbi:MAG: hypothetical protein Q9222_004314, partial [Ikaeria aurantiellina]